MEDKIVKEKWIVNLCMLFLCSVEDRKYKTVALWKICFYGIFVVSILLGEIFFQRVSLYKKLLDIVVGGIPGVFCFGISKASDQGIGYGDCWIILIMGISVGLLNVLGIIGIALLGAFLWAAFIFMSRKGGKDKEIPFLPFLTVGMAGAYLWMV